MSDFLAAALQLTSTTDPESNFAAAEEQIDLAARRGAELIALPENFAFMGDDAQRLDLAPALAEQASRFLVTMARRYQVVVLGGGFPVPVGDGQRHFQRSQLVGRDGQVLASYDKIHLFDVDLPDGSSYRESASFSPGTSPPPVVDVPGLCRVGLSICYDVRFPALYQRLAGMGAVAMTVPSAFTATTGAAHWHTLLRARAIETQSYVIAPAQHGSHSANRASYGHSLIVDPWGKIIAELPEGDGYVIGAVDSHEVHRIRREVPSLANQRPIG